MTARELIARFNETHPSSYFFSKDTLRFFGERISDMRLLGQSDVVDEDGVMRRCYVLSTLQRNHPDGPTRRTHYFDAETFDEVRKGVA